jgi:hypothetical protein
MPVRSNQPEAAMIATLGVVLLATLPVPMPLTAPVVGAWLYWARAGAS